MAAEGGCSGGGWTLDVLQLAGSSYIEDVRVCMHRSRNMGGCVFGRKNVG